MHVVGVKEINNSQQGNVQVKQIQHHQQIYNNGCIFFRCVLCMYFLRATAVPVTAVSAY